MKKTRIYLIIFHFLFSLNSFGQKLSILDLNNLLGMSLNNAETLLSLRKFEFKEVNHDDLGTDYSFGFNLDNYGGFADEYLVLYYTKNGIKSNFIWYQLYKEDWLKLKNSMVKLGYSKIKTNYESDGSLTSVYTNSKTRFEYNSSKSYYGNNKGKIIYTLTITLN